MRRALAYQRLAPRRSRRGLTALTAIILLAGLLATAATSWQIAVARERLRGEARHLAEVVAAEGFGLHHWLHGERIATPPAITTPATPRALDAAEAGRLATHPAIANWRRSSDDPTRILLPRGWQIVHLVGAAGGGLPDGVLVLRPDDEIVNRPTWDATRQALDVALGSGSGLAETLARTVLTDYDATRDRALFASRFARLDSTAVLRVRHAGHAILPMEADIDLGGHHILNVTLLEAGTGRIPSVTGTGADGTLGAADLDLRTGLTVTGETTLNTMTARNVTLAGTVAPARVRATDVQITGTLTTSELTACADPLADLCGGGDLDLEAATGAPDWTDAAIFGDVIIRDGNRLTGVTTTTAARGIFGDINGAPAITVNECFRSVRPFVHGARC